MKFELQTPARGEWTWRVRNPATGGDIVAVAPEAYESEKAARSAVLKARKAFAGAKMARVEVVDTPD